LKKECKMNQKRRVIWKVIKFNIEGEGEIYQINEKLGQHIEGIKAIHVSINPKSVVVDDCIEVGELSLLLNNQKDHAVHITSYYSPETPSEAFNALELNQSLHINPRIIGYYRDLGTLRNETTEFITHEVKVLLECIIKEES
jgi:hypothetical protein